MPEPKPVNGEVGKDAENGTNRDESLTFRRRALASAAVFLVMVLVIYSGSSLKLSSLGQALLNGVEDTEMELINRKERIARGEYAPPPPIKTNNEPVTHIKCLKKENNANIERCLFRVLSRFGKDARLYERLLPKWKELQRNLLTELTLDPPPPGLRILVVSSVSNTEASVGWLKGWLYNLALSRETAASGDVFHFALNHFDNKTSEWDALVARHKDRIVLRQFGMHCKVEFWRMITRELANSYDYLWLTDDDIDLDFFSFPLAKRLLYKLDPLVAHPAIIPASERARTSDHPELALRYAASGDKTVLAKNENFAEVMTPLIKAKFWPVVLHRLKHWDVRSVWCLDCYWSSVANKWGGGTCGFRSPVVTLLASPVVHMNRHSITRIKIKGNRGRRGCIKRYVGDNRHHSFFTRVYEKKVLQTLYSDLECKKRSKDYKPGRSWTSESVKAIGS